MESEMWGKDYNGGGSKEPGQHNASESSIWGMTAAQFATAVSPLWQEVWILSHQRD